MLNSEEDEKSLAQLFIMKRFHFKLQAIYKTEVDILPDADAGAGILTVRLHQLANTEC